MERPAIIMYVESAQPHTSIEKARKCRQKAVRSSVTAVTECIALTLHSPSGCS